MPESAPYPPTLTTATDLSIPRSIHFAVYLTGGLVTLAFGLVTMSSVMGTVLNCLNQTQACPGGFGPSAVIYYDTVPGLVAGSIMVFIAVVLFALASRNR